MAQSSIANTVYLRPNMVGLKVGLRATELFHPEAKVERYGLLLGGKTAVADVASGQLTDMFMAKKNASVIWTHPEAVPEIRRIGNMDVIFSVGVITLGRQTFFVRLEDAADGACIVEIETGMFGELNLAELKEKELFPHGSFALDPGAKLLGMQESLGEELGLPTTRGLARRFRWRVEKDIPSTLIPFHRYDVWKMLPGGQIIVQGINGESFRLVCERNHMVRRVDMPHGHEVFEGYEMDRLARKAKRAEPKIIPATLADVAALPAPEVAVTRADMPTDAEQSKKKGWLW